MTYIQCTPTQPQLIAVNRLEKSPLNARRTTGTIGMEELKASILAHGLMQNLVVTDTGDGTYRVIAGGRRLAAIHSLQSEGKLPLDFAVPCQVVADEHALELSLAENTVRLAMHPADQFEAFATLINQGESAADVAARFAVDESLVLKRMKLASVAPQLLAEYRNEGMTLECLMAYTVSDDHRRQLKVFKSLPHWDKDSPDAIRAALTEKMVEASDKLARFVGVEAYVAAGGAIRGDLFGSEVYLEKPALLQKLAEEKLEAIRKELEAEGWGWIEVNPDRDYDAIHRCGRIKPRLVGAPSELVELKTSLDSKLEAIEQALEESDEAEPDSLLEQQQTLQDQLDEVERKLAAFVGFDAGHKALAGCFVSIAGDGTPFIDKGLVKPEHRKILDKLFKIDDGRSVPVTAKPRHDMPESLRRDLAAERLPIAQVEIARHPAIALDLLAFSAASMLLGEHPVTDGPDVEFALPKRSRESQSSTANSRLDAIRKALAKGWLEPHSEAERFQAFRALPQEARMELLAYCVALTLQPKLGPAEGEEATAFDTALALTGANVADYWRPTAENFLKRRSREQLLAVSREILGQTWAISSSNMKKSLLVTQLDRVFSNPEKVSSDPDQIEKLKSWLPAGMAFEAATDGKPAKPRKSKKAA